MHTARSARVADGRAGGGEPERERRRRCNGATVVVKGLGSGAGADNGGHQGAIVWRSMISQESGPPPFGDRIERSAATLHTAMYDHVGGQVQCTVMHAANTLT